MFQIAVRLDSTLHEAKLCDACGLIATNLDPPAVPGTFTLGSCQHGTPLASLVFGVALARSVGQFEGGRFFAMTGKEEGFYADTI
jgi:hypothetical protein